MPGVTVHFVLADRLLDAWADGTAPAPIPLADPGVLNAFRHGAVGPDLGYFPGGWRPLSELAHGLATGRLARNLVREARTVRERAFAWGWVTHLLADRAIHPWIGRGVGELLHGDRHRFVDGSADLFAHLRVEMGLDAWYAMRAPAVRRRRLRPAFRGEEISFLARAYAATYGAAPDLDRFLRSHRATTRRVGQALGTLRLVHALMGGGRGLLPGVRPALLPGLGRTLRWLHRFGALRGVTLAYLTPVPPAPWLLEGVEAAMERHTARCLRAVAEGLEELPDWNLDTGRRVADDPEHPVTRRAREALAAMGGGHPSGGPVRARRPVPSLPLASEA